LGYTCDYAGIVFEAVNEAYTPDLFRIWSSLQHQPERENNLGIREWTCECGSINSCVNDTTKNILVAGHCHLAGGIPSLK
jgi:hypothetical protein